MIQWNRVLRKCHGPVGFVVDCNVESGCCTAMNESVIFGVTVPVNDVS